MEHIENYRGHKLVAWTDEKAAGKWPWHFTIDDENLTAGNVEAQTEEREVLVAAVGQARRKIDEWPKA